MILWLLLLLPAIEAEIDVAFSPQGGCQGMILEQIEDAQTRILAAVYSFTSDTIAQAFVSAHQRGVNVKVLMDEEQIDSEYSQADFLTSHGIEVRHDTHPGLMHHKFAVIDDSVTISGSYNWSWSAENRNDENLLVITSHEIVNLFEERFEMLWNQAVEWVVVEDTLNTNYTNSED